MPGILNIQMQHGTIPVMTVAKHKDGYIMVSQIVQGDCKLFIKDVKDNSVHLISAISHTDRG